MNKNQGTRELRAVKEHCEFDKVLSGMGQIGVPVFQPRRTLNARMKQAGNLVWAIV